MNAPLQSNYSLAGEKIDDRRVPAEATGALQLARPRSVCPESDAEHCDEKRLWLHFSPSSG